MILLILCLNNFLYENLLNYSFLNHTSLIFLYLRKVKLVNMYRSRLNDDANDKTLSFLSSILEDIEIIEEDIVGTEVHNIMLFEIGLLTKKELKSVLTSLENLKEKYGKIKNNDANVIISKLKISKKCEDIHEFIESRIIDDVGLSIGGKIHTGRSRNDQVLLCMILKSRNLINQISAKIIEILDILCKLSDSHKNSVMTLYTHTQHAQIGTYGHYLLAYFDIFTRDLERLNDLYKRLNLSPLGAAAIAGSSFNINRERTSSLLGFDGIVENSIDAVSSRDVFLEIGSTIAILMSNISRLAEDIILWSSSEFGFLEVSDSYCSTSSIMPQKKNPCTIELIRGGSGISYGELINMLTIVKGSYTGYNRDFQRIKPALWNSLYNASDSLIILQGVLENINVNKDIMYNVAKNSFALALDIAEYLVKHYSLSFREAHQLLGNVVNNLVSNELKLKDITSDMINKTCKKLLNKNINVTNKEIQYLIDPTNSLNNKMSSGSPSIKEVNRMLKIRRNLLKEYSRNLDKRINTIFSINDNLTKIIRSIIE